MLRIHLHRRRGILLDYFTDHTHTDSTEKNHIVSADISNPYRIHITFVHCPHPQPYSLQYRYTMNQRFVTVSVFAGQILWFSLMFTCLKFISQTCVPVIEGQTPNLKDCPDGGEVKFARPVLNALMMVGGMSLALMYFYTCLNGKKGVHEVSRKSLIYILFPSCLDAICCGLLMAGSMYIPMSLVLTLKGIRILFSSILVILIFKRKQRSYNWAGVAIAMTGVCMAAASALLNNNASAKAPAVSLTMTLVGIGLVLASELFRALMVVTQEYLIKVVKCDPSFMIGLQGVYGGAMVLLMMVLAWLVVPGKDVGGSFENMPATFELAGKSTTIIIVLAILPIFTVLGFVCSALVTKHLSSVHNAMASVMMTALVWLIEIVMNSVDSHYGAPWGPYSVMQLFGFGFVVVALLVYDGTYIRIPQLFNYPPPASLQVEAEAEIKELESRDDILLVDESTQAEISEPELSVKA